MQYTIKDSRQLYKYTPERLRALLALAQNDLQDSISILDSVGCGIILCNDDGKIQYVNKYTKKIFEKNNIEAVYIEDVFNNSEILRKINMAIQGAKQIHGEIVAISIFQDITHVLLSLFPQMCEQSIKGWILVFQDYSEQYLKQAQVRRKDYLNSITNISSSIAHELKNPLGAISIHLQIIRKSMQRKLQNQDEDVSDKQSNKKNDTLLNSIDIIEEEIENMNNIIGLFLNNMKVGSTEFLQQNLNDLVLAFKKFIEPDLSARNIQCITVLEKNLPLVLISRPSISHVLLNIVKNSIEALYNGGDIILRTYSRNPHVFLSITDTGEGVSPEAQDTIFNPYFTTKEQGSGIGLAISDKIMQLHHGRIIFDKDYSEGASFILEFPRLADEQYYIPENKDNSDMFSDEKINRREE